MIEPSSGSSKVADNIVTTRRGFRAVSRVDEEHIYCHPVLTREIDTSALGLPLPWGTVGAAR